MLVKHIKRIVNALHVVLCSALWPPLTMPYQWGNPLNDTITSVHCAYIRSLLNEEHLTHIFKKCLFALREVYFV